MATIAELQKQLDSLKEARRSGVKRVIFNERDVTYKSDDDMARAQKDLEREIRKMGNGRRRRTATLATFRSGLR
ncbi:hypothetical protein H9Q09_01105 [Aurantimonas sp. DM33-3]|uniref:phage head-tail joining protein n=1 Tax=Aurantimonas sp. DM33-3 TaxID=2766955 RepID=UPI001652788B|nr:hypothetical protein [Aurantimonas sp. DM33-3]MBC6714783.1 hypothetical protein [Aurantimonas sp. DM33-3]